MLEHDSPKNRVNLLCLPPVILLILLVASTMVHLYFFGSFNYSPVRWLIGSIIIGVGLLIIASSLQLFVKLKTPFRPNSPATTLVQSGCYRVSRNPMYLGMAGLFVGCAVIAGSVIFAVASVAFIALIHFFVILKEERYLEARYGHSYHCYKQKVRRWL